MAKATSKGMGWHKQSVRHSNARKYGFAGGRYGVGLSSNKKKSLPFKEKKKSPYDTFKYRVDLSIRKEGNLKSTELRDSANKVKGAYARLTYTPYVRETGFTVFADNKKTIKKALDKASEKGANIRWGKKFIEKQKTD